MTTSRRTNALLLFITLVAGIYGIALYLRAILPVLDGAALVAIGLTIDLTVLVPALWYLIVVRRLRWSALTVIPVFIFSVLAAARVVPAAHHQTLSLIEVLLVPIEIAVLGYVGWHAVRAFGRARGAIGSAPDPFTAIRTAAREVIPHPRVAEIAADELSVLIGGVVAWFVRRREEPALFTSYERNAHLSVVIGLLLAMAVEIFAVHVLLLGWNVVLAWIVTGLSLYAALWLLTDFHALRLRPIALAGDGLALRIGLRWDAMIPLDALAYVERVHPDVARKGEGLVNLVLFGEPTHRAVCRAPISARAIYGMRREAREFLFMVDAPDRFDARLERLGVRRGASGAADAG